jgi:hypothetical protein
MLCDQTMMDLLHVISAAFPILCYYDEVDRSSDGSLKNYYLVLLCAPEGTLSHWSWLHLQSLSHTNPHWACVVGYGPFSLSVIQKEGLCPSTGDLNRLIMMNDLSITLLRTSP